MLRKKIGGKNFPSLFTYDMLIGTLRRHFQPLDPKDFPKVAKHFLSFCFPGIELHESALSADILHSLRESLDDHLDDNCDPTAAHCRYTLVIDPTDSESSIDIMKNLQMITGKTQYQALSDFPDDQSLLRRSDVIAQIRNAIFSGITLLLSNSGPLQSALYDVINRHYQISVDSKDGSRSAFAYISLGKHSEKIRVHPNFRIIIIVPESQLGQTALPFLNRLEKYRLSAFDVLQDLIREVVASPPELLRTNMNSSADNIRKVFEGVQSGVEDFVKFCGGHNCFYGMSRTETIPGLVLRYLQGTLGTQPRLVPRQSIFAHIKSTVKRHNVSQEDLSSTEFVDINMNDDADLETKDRLDSDSASAGTINNNN
jgi:hypothetical protein